MSSSHPSHRSFLKTTRGSLLGLSTLACTSPQQRRRFDIEEEIRVAVVGLNARGRAHIDAYRKQQYVRVVALCDVDATLA